MTLTGFLHPSANPDEYCSEHADVEVLAPHDERWPATTQNLAVKFDGEICGGVLVENGSDHDPPTKEARKSPSKLRRKFATKFGENFANFTLEIAGA